MEAQVTLTITTKKGQLTGTYSVWEALARLKCAAALPDFVDFHFS
jgi:hypothetical protein